MNTIFLDHVEYYTESYVLLQHIANEKEVQKDYDEFVSRHKDDASILQKYALIRSIVDRAKVAFNKEEIEQIIYYFTKLSGIQSDLASFCVFRKEYNYQSIDVERELTKNLSEEEFSKNFVMAMLNIMEDYSEEENKIVDKISALEFLTTINATAEEKVHITEIFFQHEKNSQIVFSLLEKGICILKEFSQEIENVYFRLLDHWKNEFKNEDVIQVMKKKLQISMEPNELGNVIIPQIMASRAISVAAHAEDYKADFKSPYVVRIGMMFGEDLPFSIEPVVQTSTEDLCQFMKLLSDTSKFEILQLIKDKPAYGAELAKKMSLTTATISYHMSALVQSGLVEITQEEKRIYYKVNERTMQHYMDELRKRL